MVDLHDLYVPEAVEYAKEELQSAVYRDDGTVRFIVGMYLFFYVMTFQRLTCLVLRPGKGLHNKDGVSKLRPALEKLFDEYVGKYFVLRRFRSTYTLLTLDAG